MPSGMFLDASAMVAILGREEGHEIFLNVIDEANGPIVTTALALFETAQALVRKRVLEPDSACRQIRVWLDDLEIDVFPIEASAFEIAVQAAIDYGKGRGNPAQLNMGDCFAYACAKSLGVSLLYKGDDFSKTDLQSALG